MDSPRLQRKVRGNFVIQVRLSGAPRTTPRGFRSVGLFLSDERLVVRWVRVLSLPAERAGRSLAIELAPLPRRGAKVATEAPDVFGGAPLDEPVYIRLERDRDVVYWSWSSDGKEWMLDGRVLNVVKMPEKVTVGVFAESTAEGTFKAEFDEVSLTTPDDSRRP